MRSIAWSAVDLLLAWHLHIAVGFSGIETSVLLFTLLLTGSVSVLAIGYWPSRSRAKAQDYVRLQLVGAVASAVLLAVQFVFRDAVAVIVAGIAFRHRAVRNRFPRAWICDRRSADRRRVRHRIDRGAGRWPLGAEFLRRPIPGAIASIERIARTRHPVDALLRCSASAALGCPLSRFRVLMDALAAP